MPQDSTFSDAPFLRDALALAAALIRLAAVLLARRPPRRPHGRTQGATTTPADGDAQVPDRRHLPPSPRDDHGQTSPACGDRVMGRAVNAGRDSCIQFP